MLNEEQIRNVVRPLASARTLPPDAYVREDVFTAEVREIFSREWICVAREEQIPEPGDYRRVDVVDQPLLVVRTKTGAVKAMSAICPHRSMLIASDHGNTGTFSCPYHLWKFSLDGELISAPLMDGADDFPNPDCNLTSVRCEIWQGFVFINLDERAPGLNSRLASLNVLMDGYDMADMVAVTSLDFDCPWNWKILVENFMEAYHHIGPHNGSVQPTYPAKDSYVSGSVDEGWSVLHMPETTDRHESEAELPALPNLSGTQQCEIRASVIMPTFCWLNTPSVAFWYQLNPSAYDQMTLTIHTLLPRSLAEAPGGDEIAALVQASIEAIHLEDIAVNEGPWRGLQAPLTRQGQLSPLEESIWQLNQWWVAKVHGPV